MADSKLKGSVEIGSTREGKKVRRARLRLGGADGSMCGCYLALFLISVTVGGFAFHYDCETILGVEVPSVWLCMLGGAFLGTLTIPLAVICWILVMCGVHAPFFHMVGAH